MSKPDMAKLSIIRARLWANVYHTAAETQKNLSESGQSAIMDPCLEADKALRSFDGRFPEVAASAKKAA